MEGETFTYTARSSKNPDKMVTFTLNNGHVSMQLGNTLLEHLEKATEAQQTAADIPVSEWAKPVAIGALQKIARPLPINDFDAAVEADSFQATTWLRSGGLRLAPIVMTWDEVDNPVAARAFAQEVNKRRESAQPVNELPAVFDYWISWVAAGTSLIVFLVMLSRLLQRSNEA